jgi:hypothetical protein
MQNAGPLTLGQAALAELRARDEEHGVDPLAYKAIPSEPSVYGPPLHIPRWDDPTEGSSFIQPVREPDPPEPDQDTDSPAAAEQTEPAPPTPNFDRWRAILRGDKP